MAGARKFILILVTLSTKFVLAGVPKITSFGPGRGAGGTTIAIAGSGFTGATEVKVGITAAPSFTVHSDSVMEITTGPFTFTGPITITTPDGVGSSAGTSSGFWKDGLFISDCEPRVDIRRSLGINMPLVTDNPRAQGLGSWSFNKLMTEMAPVGMSGSEFIKRWFKNWMDTTKINGFPVDKPSAALADFLAKWPRVTGKGLEFDNTAPLDLNITKMRLIAILFRPDLTDNAVNIAGEGRFVFAFDTGVEETSQDEIILEYKLPISSGTNPTSLAKWINDIYRLTYVSRVDTNYLASLERLTNQFTKKTFLNLPGFVNGSAINQVRTNTIAIENNIWKLREFRLTPSAIAQSSTSGAVGAVAGQLVGVPVKGNPDDSFWGASPKDPALVNWLLQNMAAFQSGNPIDLPVNFWGGVASANRAVLPRSIEADVRKPFMLSTCRGCHNPEFGFGFIHAGPFGFSQFMTGNTNFENVVPDPIVDIGEKIVPSFFRINTATRTATRVDNYSDLRVRARVLLQKVSENFCR